MQTWKKPSEIDQEGQYLLAYHSSDHIQLLEVHSVLDRFSQEEEYFEIETPLGLPPNWVQICDKYDDEEYRVLGPIRAPIWI